MKEKIHTFTDNLDVIDNSPVIVTAEISMILEENGGRCCSFTNGYRPNHNFGDSENSLFFIGEIQLDEGEWFHLRKGVSPIILVFLLVFIFA